MSFLNIYPAKRDQLVNEILKRQRNIQSDNLSKRIGDIEMNREFSKVFAPITESQQKVGETFTQGTQKAISNIPNKLSIETLPQQQQAIEFPKLSAKNIGPIAKRNLMRYINKTADRDTTLGIYGKNGKMFIGNKDIDIDNDDIIIDDLRLKGTTGLWELLTSNNPQNFLEDDVSEYGRILFYTDAIYRNYNSDSNYPNPNKSKKWKNIVSNIWKYCHFNEVPLLRSGTPEEHKLLKQFYDLMDMKEEGNTEASDKMFSIIDQLRDRGLLTPELIKFMESQAAAELE